MRLEYSRWPVIEEYFKDNDTVLIGIGSCESHGRHMPLGTDMIIPGYLMDKIEKKSDVLMLPVLPFGACDSLREFPGTINLGNELLYQLMSQVCNELYRHGARHFIVLNGHGGNLKSLDQVGFDLRRKGAIMAQLNWWLMAWDMNPQWKGGHGGGEETAAILAINESLVDKTEIGGPLEMHDLTPEITASGFNTSLYKGVNIHIPRLVTDITDSGWIGPDHPNTATVEWGNEMLDTTADYIVDFIEAFKKAPLKTEAGVGK
ncbi:creatininase family protein [Proteiniclasticum sp. QWL-01]|uniref:creatininase family protein n=1 Tax=Proteiniclasticum sp. QWL-01 TaxID=3036945 RepID=UPI0024115FFE|nr:creatininase family protein [Proteiniclasticum sp. QWL-01]WFF73469.1 creatininase family protein [Proteiniclasticum sp. QWL-01]